MRAAIGGAAAPQGAERARARLPQQRRRHHAGGREDRLGMFVPKGHRGGQHQGAFGRFEAGVPHRHGADPCTDLPLTVLDQRQFGVGGGDRRRGVAGPRPRGARSASAVSARDSCSRLDRWATMPCSNSPRPNTTSPRAAASRPSTIPIRRKVRCARCPTRSISEFTTRAGRKVYDGGGVMPDIATDPEYISAASP